MFSLVYIYNLTSTISSFAFWFWPFRLCVHINNVCPCSKPGYGFPTSCRFFFLFMFNDLKWEVVVRIDDIGATSGAGTTYPFGAPEFTPVFSGVRVTRSLVLCVCRSLFVLLSFFFWPLCCLFFDIRILITPLVSSNCS